MVKEHRTKMFNAVWIFGEYELILEIIKCFFNPKKNNKKFAEVGKCVRDWINLL